MPAAEAGSEKTPSSVRRFFQASRISSSLTVTSEPPERSIASCTHFSCTGSTMRIAEATVSGRRAASTGYRRGSRADELLEAARDRARVAAAAVRERDDVGDAAELLGDLGGDAHLALDAVLAAARVDERRPGLGRELLGVRERVRERAVDLDDPPADRAHLHELRGRDRAGRDDDHRLDPGPRGVRGAGGGGVPRGRADEPRDSALDRPRRRDAPCRGP